MTAYEQRDGARSLAAWLRYAQGGWPALVACLVAGLAIALVAAKAQPLRYRATGSIVLSSSRGFLDPHNAVTLARYAGDTTVHLATTPIVLHLTRRLFIASATSGAEASQRARIATDRWLDARISAGSDKQTSTVTLNGLASSAGDSLALTRATVRALVHVINAQTPRLRVSPRRRRIHGVLRPAIPSPPVPVGLEARVEDLGASAGLVSPLRTRDMILGLNAGFLLGVPAAFVLASRRRRRHGGEDVRNPASAAFDSRLRRR